MLKLPMISFLAVLVAGCGTTPTPLSEAIPIEKNRLYGFQEKTETKNATIILTRDSGAAGSACYFGFWIDSTLAARFDTSETAHFFVEPGERLLRVGRDPMGNGLCANLDPSQTTQRESTFKPNERKQYRLKLNSSGEVDVQRWE